MARCAIFRKLREHLIRVDDTTLLPQMSAELRDSINKRWYLFDAPGTVEGSRIRLIDAARKQRIL